AFGGWRMQIGAPFRRESSDGPETAEVEHRLDVAPVRLTDLGRIAGWFVVIYGVGVAVGHTVKALSSDGAINVWFAERRSGVLNTLTDAGSAFSDTSTVVIALVLAAIVLVIVTRRWHEAAFLVGAVALETSGFLAIAYTVGRDRPAVAQLDVSPPTASFPSGHTAAAVALYVGLALLMRWHAEKRWTKAVAYSAAVVIPSIVALSRIYRGMHFTTDVVAGLALGLASVWVLATMYERRRPAEEPPADSAPTNQQTNGHRPTGTPSRRIAVVANPVGAEQPSRQLKQLMHDRDIDADWFETTEDDPGIGQTRRAVEGGVDVVVACGGDGTVRACIESVAHTDTALAVLPAGTGNLLATNLSIPDTAGELLDSILHGDTTRIDIGRANGETFAVMAGVGLDARVMRDTARSAKDRFGVLAYVAEGIRHVSDEPVACTVTVDGQPVYQGDAATVLVGNLGEIQTGLSLFPDGSATDGRLDVLIIEADDAGSWARTGWEILTRSSTSGSPTHRFSGKEVRVDLDEPTPYELDGEPRPPVTRIEFHCTPAALEVAVPRETP
ncbi:MAG: phosphatase PAP2 family protein, partial [Acidimicrobiia bacterium]|nr:phosphatase PAP2 family protein [Acidimicrobiia bacterium]